MVKFSAGSANGKRKLIGLGLTRENIRKMDLGFPIKVMLDDMGFPGVEIAIFTGEDEASIGIMLRAANLIGEDTEVHIDPKLKGM